MKNSMTDMVDYGIHQVRVRLSVQLLQADLDAGESEAIVLAAEIHMSEALYREALASANEVDL